MRMGGAKQTGRCVGYGKQILLHNNLLIHNDGWSSTSNHQCTQVMLVSYLSLLLARLREQILSMLLCRLRRAVIACFRHSLSSSSWLFSSSCYRDRAGILFILFSWILRLIMYDHNDQWSCKASLISLQHIWQVSWISWTSTTAGQLE